MARGAPKGNDFAKGNPGGGRPSVKETEWHIKLFKGVPQVDGTIEPLYDLEKLKAKVKTGKFTGADMYALRVMTGDTMILKNLADKVLADLHDLKSDGKFLGIPILGNALSTDNGDK